MTGIYIKTTTDGRKVEVIEGVICLAGVRESDRLIEIDDHPNRQAIQKAVPGATHVAGRLPLTRREASIAKAAMVRSRQDYDSSPRAIAERLRKALYQRAMLEGVE